MKYRHTTYIGTGSKNAIWFGLVFSGIGSLVAIFGFISLLRGMELQTSGIITTGHVQIVEFKYSRDRDGDKIKKYTSIVSFQDKLGHPQRVTFKKKLTENTPISLIYLADKPNEAQINSTTNMVLGPLFMMIMGGGFSALGIWISIGSKKRQEEIAWLTSRGQRISAQVIGIKERTRTQSNSRIKKIRSYQVIARHEDYQERFTSESTSREFDDSYIGKSITVFLNPQNPQSYYVDLNSLERISL